METPLQGPYRTRHSKKHYTRSLRVLLFIVWEQTPSVYVWSLDISRKCPKLISDSLYLFIYFIIYLFRNLFISHLFI